MKFSCLLGSNRDQDTEKKYTQIAKCQTDTTKVFVHIYKRTDRTKVDCLRKQKSRRELLRERDLTTFILTRNNLRSGSIFVSLGETFRREGRNEK